MIEIEVFVEEIEIEVFVEEGHAYTYNGLTRYFNVLPGDLLTRSLL